MRVFLDSRGVDSCLGMVAARSAVMGTTASYKKGRWVERSKEKVSEQRLKRSKCD